MVDYTLFCGRKSVLDLSEESLFFERERERRVGVSVTSEFTTR